MSVSVMQLKIVSSKFKNELQSDDYLDYYSHSYGADDDESTREIICCAISAEALGFAAFKALSHISTIKPSFSVEQILQY